MRDIASLMSVSGGRYLATSKAGAAVFPRRWLPQPVAWLALVVAAASLLPLGFVLWVAVQTGRAQVWALIVRPRVGELLVNTALLELCTLPPAIALALATAWLIDRTDVPLRSLWSWLAIAPLAIPAFVQSYAWNTAAPQAHGLAGAALVSVLTYYPFVYLPISAQLRRLDPALEDAGSALGLGPARIFFEILLPQLRLSICTGGLLIGLHLLAEYGLFAMLRFDTFTTAIVDQFQSAYNGPAANMLAIVLVGCCLVLLRGESFLRGGERYARVGQGAPRNPTLHRLGRSAPAWLCLPVLTALLSLGVPLAVVFRWLGIGGAAAWTGEVGTALAQTLALAVAGALLATVAAAPMSWLSVRSPGRLARLLEACHYYVGSLPGVVVALALVTIIVRFAPLYQTAATLLFAYAILFLPRAVAGLRPSIAQVPVELERAAGALGRTPGQAIREISLRLAAPGAAASFALVALGITTELTATLMLAPNGTRTLATGFWALTSEIDYPAAAPYALAMIVASAPMTLLLHAHARRRLG